MPERRYFIAGTAFEAPELAPGLYVVATPIGNLRDITIRALETLAAADVIFCEDTRTSAKLRDHFGIKTPRKALHEHNERALVDTILADLGRGGRVALISDAGTPLLSDPGFPLVRAAREAGSAGLCRPRRLGAAGGAGGGGPADRCLQLSRLPAGQGRGAGQRAGRSRRRAAKRWCSTNPRAGSARRCPPWPMPLAQSGRPPWRWS